MIQSLQNNNSHSSHFSSYSLGLSAQGQPIKAFEFGAPHFPRVLCLGGAHGDEIEGVCLAWSLWEEFIKNYLFRLNLVLIPELNPDGVLYKTRCNANNVDLNRNLPTADWTAQVLNPRYPPGTTAGSEPENQALLKLWNKHPVQFVFSLHSWNPLINTNGPCEPEAQILHQFLGSPVEATIGYPTPGSLGSFAGLEKGVGTITLEIQRGLKISEVIAQYKPALFAALQSLDQRLNKE